MSFCGLLLWRGHGLVRMPLHRGSVAGSTVADSWVVIAMRSRTGPDGEHMLLLLCATSSLMLFRR